VGEYDVAGLFFKDPGSTGAILAAGVFFLCPGRCPEVPAAAWNGHFTRSRGGWEESSFAVLRPVRGRSRVRLVSRGAAECRGAAAGPRRGPA
jgi:hypothetical protein